MATWLTFLRKLNRGYRWRLMYIIIITFLMLLAVRHYKSQSPEVTQLFINTVKDSSKQIFPLLNKSKAARLIKISKIWKQNMYNVLNLGHGYDEGCKQMLSKFAGNAYMLKTVEDVLHTGKRNQSDRVKYLPKNNITHNVVVISKKKPNVSLNVSRITTKTNIDNLTLPKILKNPVGYYISSPSKQKVSPKVIVPEKQVNHHRNVPVERKVKNHKPNAPEQVLKHTTTIPTKQRYSAIVTSFASVQQQAGSKETSYQDTGHTLSRSAIAKPKTILWFLKTPYQPIMKQLHPLSACPAARCRVTTNWEYYYSSSALIFSARSLTWPNPPPRLSNQVWIFHNHESPQTYWLNLTTFKHSQWRRLFNWTMDYRKDADIVSPYGILVKKGSAVYKNYSRIVSQKLGPVSWLVSNCYAESKRNKYVSELKKYLKVKVFGFCGGSPCGRHIDNECLGKINNYKFYLAFENAFCRDYLTEKFYRWYTADVVLVVRGGANYKRDLPLGTYINTADFSTVQDLANYLNFLDRHDDKYIEYLKNKDQYDSVYEDYITRNANGNIQYVHYHYEQVPLCEVCKRLWNLDRYKQTYDDIGRWFQHGRCYAPNDI